MDTPDTQLSRLKWIPRIYKAASYKVDTYHLFLEKASLLVNPNGIFSLITPSNFTTNNGLKSLRLLLLEESHITQIVNLSAGVFDQASVDTAIIIAKKSSMSRRANILRGGLHHDKGFHISDDFILDIDKAVKDEFHLFTQKNSQASSITFVADKMAFCGTPLSEICHINFGKQLRDRRIYKNDVVLWDAIDDKRFYERCYTGKNCGRYTIEWTGLALYNREEARCGGCWDNDKHNSKGKILTKQIAGFSDTWLQRTVTDISRRYSMKALHTQRVVNMRPAL